jgi:hypothetical protein
MPSWEELKRIVRVATILAIVTGTTLLATFIRDDWVGVVAGLCSGAILGVVFVYANWPSLDE